MPITTQLWNNGHWTYTWLMSIQLIVPVDTCRGIFFSKCKAKPHTTQLSSNHIFWTCIVTFNGLNKSQVSPTIKLANKNIKVRDEGSIFIDTNHNWYVFLIIGSSHIHCYFSYWPRSQTIISTICLDSCLIYIPYVGFCVMMSRMICCNGGL